MFEKIDKALSYTEGVFISIGILVPSFVLFANVVLRYWFKSGLVWADEFTRYCIIWVTFIGSSLAVREGAHLAVTALLEVLKGAAKNIIIGISHIISIIFTIFLTVYGTSNVMQAAASNQLTPSMEVPIYIIYIAIPLGGVLMTFRYMQELAKLIKNMQEGEI